MNALFYGGTEERAKRASQEEPPSNGSGTSGQSGVKQDVYKRLSESEPGNVPKLPLHLQMRSDGVPYASWPPTAKAMLSQRERDAYDHEEQKRAEPTRFEQMIGQKRRGQYDFVSPEQRAQAHQQGADLFNNATNMRRQQLQSPNALAQPANSREELMGGTAPNNIRWQEVAEGLQRAVASGEMSREQAAAYLDKHLARVGMPASQNIFRHEMAG